MVRIDACVDDSDDPSPGDALLLSVAKFNDARLRVARRTSSEQGRRSMRPEPPVCRPEWQLWIG